MTSITGFFVDIVHSTSFVRGLRCSGFKREGLQCFFNARSAAAGRRARSAAAGAGQGQHLIFGTTVLVHKRPEYLPPLSSMAEEPEVEPEAEAEAEAEGPG